MRSSNAALIILVGAILGLPAVSRANDLKQMKHAVYGTVASIEMGRGSSSPRWTFIRSPGSRSTDVFLQAIRSRGKRAGIAFAVLDLSGRRASDPKGEIESFLKAHYPKGVPSQLALAITGLDASLAREGSSPSDFVQRINMQRESLAAVRTPLVFVGSNESISEIQHNAPDFYSWRTQQKTLPLMPSRK